MWLGRLDSNQGLRESKSRGLPLAYAPIFFIKIFSTILINYRFHQSFGSYIP